MQRKEGRIVLMEKGVSTLYCSDKIAVTTVGSKKNCYNISQPVSLADQL